MQNNYEWIVRFTDSIGDGRGSYTSRAKARKAAAELRRQGAKTKTIIARRY